MSLKNPTLITVNCIIKRRRTSHEKKRDQQSGEPIVQNTKIENTKKENIKIQSS